MKNNEYLDTNEKWNINKFKLQWNGKQSRVQYSTMMS